MVPNREPIVQELLQGPIERAKLVGSQIGCELPPGKSEIVSAISSRSLASLRSRSRNPARISRFKALRQKTHLPVLEEVGETTNRPGHHGIPAAMASSTEMGIPSVWVGRK